MIAERQPRTVEPGKRPKLQPVRAVESAPAGAPALEYRVIYVARSMAGQPNEGVEDDLNKAAREGWRLVGSLTNDEARTTGLILERRQLNVPLSEVT